MVRLISVVLIAFAVSATAVPSYAAQHHKGGGHHSSGGKHGGGIKGLGGLKGLSGVIGLIDALAR